jgi:hypothetical protein
MKSLFTIVAAGLLASSFAVSADAAAKKKDPAMAQHQAKCQAQAKKKYSAIHFLKRHAFVKSCMNQPTAPITLRALTTVASVGAHSRPPSAAPRTSS